MPCIIVLLPSGKCIHNAQISPSLLDLVVGFPFAVFQLYVFRIFFFYCRFIVITACYADIAFVIDNSGSIRDNELPGGNNWQLILDFVKSIVNMFTISPDVTRIAVVDFGWCCCQLFVCFSFSFSVFPFSLLPLYV